MKARTRSFGTNHRIQRGFPSRSAAKLGVALALVLGAAPFVAKAFPAFAPAPLAQSGTPVPPEDVIPAGTGKVIPVVISGLGFDAQGFVCQAGPQRFMLRNNAGLSGETLTGVILDASTEQVLLTEPVADRWNVIIDVTLPPGQYVVTEASHPTWRLPITVVP